LAAPRRRWAAELLYFWFHRLTPRQRFGPDADEELRKRFASELQALCNRPATEFLDDPQVALISHRGIHQTFDREGLENDTCTAERIAPPQHAYLENTLPAMRAAFASGADIVEIDVHPTTDGRLAVFHDWTLDCRTNGSGETRSHDIAYLQTLDVGYGYTADGGNTFPFRGKGVGMLPALEEVFTDFPDGRFLVNFKSNEPHEGDMVADMLAARPT